MITVRNLTIVGILLMLILPWTSKGDDTGTTSTGTIDPIYIEHADYSQLASTIVGRHITVHCGDLPMREYGHTIQISINGETYFEPDIWMQRYACTGLNMLLHYKPKRFTVQSTWQSDRYDLMAIALLTITHEADHIILNNIDEGIVECYAFHHLYNTLNLFNLPRRVAREVYLTAKVLHYESEPAYRTRC